MPVISSFTKLVKRIDVPLKPNSPPGLIEANVVDPWVKAGQYGLGWTYFAVTLVGLVLLVRLWHYWQDKLRQAMYKQEVEEYYNNLAVLAEEQYVMQIEEQHRLQREEEQRGGPGAQVLSPIGESPSSPPSSTRQVPASPFWQSPATRARPYMDEEERERAEAKKNKKKNKKDESHTERTIFTDSSFNPRAHFTSVGFINDVLALFRWIFYRPIPDVHIGSFRFTFASLAVLVCVAIALSFVALYTFLQQPLYWQSIRFGSPPVAIRAGMLSVAMTPWIIATSMKANIVSFLIGIGPERLNVFHRWAAYICLFLALVHTIPFYVQPVWEDGGMEVFGKLFPAGSGIIYGSGIACLVPLGWLCVASLPFLRRIAYELFVTLHIPVAAVYIGMLFWHTKNYLASYNYLYTSVAIWAFCYSVRFFKLNWVRPWFPSFMCGDEAAITLMTEDAIKITIPTRMRWKPGQYVYLRMPGISVLDNHPFTITSLCSDDFPSEYGEAYRDCVLVFKPYGGFTRRLLETAVEKGPFHTYRAFLDGPYGGMRRDLAAFDTCVLIAGGSGITALVSQLLDLIKRMRDGKAITRKVVVVWSIKRLESLDWFREEIRICRDAAPPGSVTCKFFVTASKQAPAEPYQGIKSRAPRPISNMFHDKLDSIAAGIASKRNSAQIIAEANGDPVREQELREENKDRLAALPSLKNQHSNTNIGNPRASPAPSVATQNSQTPLSPQEETLRQLESNLDSSNENGDNDFPGLSSDSKQPLPPQLAHIQTTGLPGTTQSGVFGPPAGFGFGFPETPSEFQRNLMRSAFPVPHEIDGGWTIEYGRPDLGFMLKRWATGGKDGRGVLGRRTAVFVCGPPSMRVGVANTVARLQAEIWGDDELEEIFLHTENYAL